MSFTFPLFPRTQLCARSSSNKHSFRERRRRRRRRRKVYSGANAVNQEDPEGDRATQEGYMQDLSCCNRS